MVSTKARRRAQQRTQPRARWRSRDSLHIHASCATTSPTSRIFGTDLVDPTYGQVPFFHQGKRGNDEQASHLGQFAFVGVRDSAGRRLRGGGGPNNVANLVFAAKGGDGSPVFAQRIAGLGQTAVWDAGNLGIGFTETDLTTIEMRYDGISSLADAAVTMLSPMTSRAIARA